MTIAIYKHEYVANDDYKCHQCNLVALCPSVESAHKYLNGQNNDEKYVAKDGNTYPYYVVADWHTRERIEL